MWTAPKTDVFKYATLSTPSYYGSARAGENSIHLVPDLQYQYDEEQESSKRSHPEIEFEPVVNPIPRAPALGTGISCDAFTSYAQDCTRNSAIIYNSSRKTPPMPAKMSSWCKAIRLLTNCAIDWNSECKEMTESLFNEESIKGHMHVVNHICDDDWFLAHYDSLPACIDRVAEAWESCYVAYKHVVDHEKNRTQDWTHFATHFYLCCARTKFRRCTLDAIFLAPASKCPHDEAVVLQKFSVIVSEGDVFQDCDSHMSYHSCPGGDPRPPSALLSKLMNAEAQHEMALSENSHPTAPRANYPQLLTLVFLIKLCL